MLSIAASRRLGLDHRCAEKRSVCTVITGFIVLLTLVACAEPVSPAAESATSDSATCVPSCASRTCGDDGCGGSCGACARGQLCDPAGTCTEDCATSCAEAGQECGDHCGASCGTCAAGSWCDGGSCACIPDCAGKHCTAEDSCGGTCGPCPIDVSCDDCGLRLVVVDRDVVDGALISVVLAVEYQAAPGAAAPHLADLRLALHGPWRVLEVGLGTPLIETGKSLFIDPESGTAWQTLPDGHVRTLVMSTGGAAPLPEGRWVYFRVAPDTAVAPAALPLVATLVPREGILAPRAADEALWGDALEQPVVVWPVDVLGPAPARGTP